ncbi:MAG TPA: MgtC/SapB family protein [Edaphobacter sp.]|jgi:putative Mg2+ transporter-C (MgtC) family protein|nr:MgtC/SapB family protein [Edaphobacter sp.]
MTLHLTEIGLRLVTATVLASLVGLDRERQRSSAGLRTHALVGMSSCLFMIASAFGFADVLGTPNVALDPSRIAAQIVTGVGFLGAGTIIAHGSLIRGLTTAASVWTVAAIGLAVGGGMYRAAVIATSLALILLLVVRPIERRLQRRWHGKTITAVFDPKVSTPERILGTLRAMNLHIGAMSLEKMPGGARDKIEITLAENGEMAMQNALQAVSRLEGIHSTTTD